MKTRNENIKAILTQIDATKMYKKELGAYFFTVNDVDYMVTDTDYKICSIYRGHQVELNVTGSKKGRYPQVIIGGYPMKAYVLTMALTVPNFYEMYVNKGMTVNHTVVSRVESADSSYTGYYDDWGCPLRYSISNRPNREVWYNPKYLEMVTEQYNTLHAKFLKKYGLYDCYFSAYDMDEIETVCELQEINWGIDEEDEVNEKMANNLCEVESYYRGVGFTEKVTF